MSEELTREEKRAIDSLKRLARQWPDSLWIFAAGGALNVMKKGADGEQVHDANGVDQEQTLETVHIESDGGDW